MTDTVESIEDIGEALRRNHHELVALGESADAPLYLVGGAVRDLLLGRPRADVDLVTVGDVGALAASLDAEPVEHERFGTAKARFEGHVIDIAGARSESYPHPGSLPEVKPATEIETDLGRRDFTINAMAIPLRREVALIDPFGGRADLEAGVLRVLHERSFEDDPTRAVRAARYAARFDFALEPETATLVRAADLLSVSADRRRTELLRLAGEQNAARGFELLVEWGLVEPRQGGIALVAAAAELLSAPTWRGTASREEALLAAALGPTGDEEALARARPEKPSAAVALAHNHDPVELVLARALGAEWLDRYMDEWRGIVLEIDGDDLVRAGVTQGPRVGLGLAEALRRKLDGEISGHDEELSVALAAAEGSR